MKEITLLKAINIQKQLPLTTNRLPVCHRIGKPQGIIIRHDGVLILRDGMFFVFSWIPGTTNQENISSLKMKGVI